ncbi:Olfactory receptor 2G6 [Bienertia sinuspersici]
MELALASTRKLGFVTGGVKKDKTNAVKQEAWETCNSMVITWILANVSDTIKRTTQTPNGRRTKLFRFLNVLDVVNGSIRTQIIMKPQLPIADKTCNPVHKRSLKERC